MQNIIVLDLEGARSADDCVHCYHPQSDHCASGACPSDVEQRGLTRFVPIGWNNRSALGLSIGCYWDYLDQRVHWFDVPSLANTVATLTARQPLMVSFNGIGFDFPLMRGLLRRHAETLQPDEALPLVAMWALDPKKAFEGSIL